MQKTIQKRVKLLAGFLRATLILDMDTGFYDLVRKGKEPTMKLIYLPFYLTLSFDDIS